jgi:hypothetical protein
LSKFGMKSTVSLSMSASSSVASGASLVSVDGSEVPLTVDQRIAKREVLHHAHERVVDGGVAVRVVFAEHVADDGRALLVRPFGGEPRLVHRVQDAPMHGLEAVAHVGERALHDHAHGVVEE